MNDDGEKRTRNQIFAKLSYYLRGLSALSIREAFVRTSSYNSWVSFHVEPDLIAKPQTVCHFSAYPMPVSKHDIPLFSTTAPDSVHHALKLRNSADLWCGFSKSAREWYRSTIMNSSSAWSEAHSSSAEARVGEGQREAQKTFRECVSGSRTAQRRRLVRLDVRCENPPASLELVDHLDLELDANVQAENTHGDTGASKRGALCN